MKVPGGFDVAKSVELQSHPADQRDVVVAIVHGKLEEDHARVLYAEGAKERIKQTIR